MPAGGVGSLLLPCLGRLFTHDDDGDDDGDGDDADGDDDDADGDDGYTIMFASYI